MANFALEIDLVDQIFRVGFWMKPVQVLHRVSFSVPEGAIFGFLGANGAGKTTLIHLITGLRRATGGSVRVFGKDSCSISAKSKVGYLPERPYFYDHLTGEGLLLYCGALAGLSRSEIFSQIPRILDLVGMGHARKKLLRTYSKGMLQRIGIAQALIHDPSLLVLDEPMSGLDPVGRKEMRELILSLAAEGRTIFFSSHVIPDVEAICDQIALIQKGRLMEAGPIHRFLESAEQSFEFSLAGVSVEACEQWPELQSVRAVSGGVRAVVLGQSAVDQTLEKLVRARVRVVSLTPIQPSLESLFEKGERRS